MAALFVSLLGLCVASSWAQTVAPIVINIPHYNETGEFEEGDPLDEHDFYLAGGLEQKYLDPPEDPRLLEMAGLFEGDILQPIDNYLYNSIRGKQNLWPNGRISYIISKSIGRELRAVIARAVMIYRRETCITWVPRTYEENYVVITNNQNGCFSQIGRRGGGQILNLGPGCGLVGIALHEMMHAAGFFHEQSRPDRDQYIQVNWNNIENGMEYNFQKMGPNVIDNLGEPYDYSSIMHYPSNAFARDPSIPTIIPRDERVTQLGGYQFTQIDLRKLNKLYHCNNSPDPIGPSSTPKPPVPEVITPRPILPRDCIDHYINCVPWAWQGLCKSLRPWMYRSCAKACGICPENVKK